MLVLERTVEITIDESDFRVEVLRADDGLAVWARVYQEVAADTADGLGIVALDGGGKYRRGPLRGWITLATRRYPSSDSADTVLTNEIAELRLRQGQKAAA